MEKLISNYRKRPAKRGAGKGRLSLFLLLATVTLIFLSSSLSVVIGLLWLGGMLSFLIMLAGMNEDLSRDGAHRPEVAISACIENKRIGRAKLFFTTFNE
jgi:hypothetical protein